MISAQGVVMLRAFVPAKDFAVSERFYTDLGFGCTALGENMAELRIGSAAFLLQDYFVQEWAENCVMHLLVDDLDQWWRHIASLDLEARYRVVAPQPPKLEPWGLRILYLFDPSGVLWHIAADLRQPSG